MDSSPVLRQQSQNKIRTDFLRMKNEHNKKPTDPKPSKPLSASHLSNKDSENKDPGSSDIGRKAPVRPGVSRLPVLAKSVHLQTPSDFSQSHCRWEEKPLAGKAKVRKPYTRPVPFNLSQPKNTRTATENQQQPTVPQSRTGIHAIQPGNNVCNAKPSKHPAGLNSNGSSTKGLGKSRGKGTENVSHLSGQSGPSSTFKTSAALSNPLSSIGNNTVHQSSAASTTQPANSAEVCLNSMNLLSLKDSSTTSHASQTTQGNPSKGLIDKGENFQPDHAALLSILQNDGVRVAGLASATPQSKPYNYLPQRVSIMKSGHKAGPTTDKSENFQSDPAALLSILQNKGVRVTGLASATPQSKPYNCRPQRVSVMKSRQKAGPTAGSVKSVQFSPDPSALQSILHNEGLKAGGLGGAAPRDSVCSTGRSTSIYKAQRVPVRKNRAETTGGPAAVALKETPLKKWTPQRVPNTRHQPMSAMKWYLSTPYTTPGLKSCKPNPQPCQEDVVQRLFEDQEDEQSTSATDRDPKTREEQLPAQAAPTKSHCEEQVETSRNNDDDEEEEEDEQKFVGGQMFLQAPHRESVIFFSTGKKLIRAPHFEKQESSAQQDESEPNLQNNPAVQRLHRDVIGKKTSSLSPAVAMLRKRFPPLEELLMDEEVATYTSVSVPAPVRFLPFRPRCENPLASILDFEESSRFVPIGFQLSSGPPPLLET